MLEENKLAFVSIPVSCILKTEICKLTATTLSVSLDHCHSTYKVKYFLSSPARRDGKWTDLGSDQNVIWKIHFDFAGIRSALHAVPCETSIEKGYLLQSPGNMQSISLFICMCTQLLNHAGSFSLCISFKHMMRGK